MNLAPVLLGTGGDPTIEVAAASGLTSEPLLKVKL